MQSPISRFVFLSAFLLTYLAWASIRNVLVDPRAGRNRIHSRNTTRGYPGENLLEIQKRDGQKYVFMHVIVGNTYFYSQSDWSNDFQRMQSKGVDAAALNIGSDSFEADRVASAYAAAEAMGNSFKLFLSFDFTAMGCDVDDLVSLVNQYANHPSQFNVNGKPMISSFEGGCLGDSGWSDLKSRTNGYAMPFISGLENQFDSWPSLDSWFCWGCAWPQGDYDKTNQDDEYYISQLGSRFATTVSGWMFAHYSTKNMYLRGDDWLINNRWDELVSMRDQLTFVEMPTWNDFGESDYFGPITTDSDMPSGTTWAVGFPHDAWFDMSEYYITAYKTGSYPQITEDVIYYWSRPHPAAATPTSDPLPKPSGWDWTEDSLWAAVFATSPSTVYLQCGSSSQTFTVQAGVSKLKIPNSPGSITVRMIKNGVTVIDQTPSDFTFVSNPTIYNLNAYVGSAKASTSNSGSSYLGCVAEGTTGSRRALTGASYTGRPDMTPQVCQSLCSGFQYAGVEYGDECYCGNSLTNNGATGNVISSNNCNVPCAGDTSQICGAGWTLSVYTNGQSGGGGSNPTSTATQAGPTGTGFTSYGCVAEGTTGSRRALTGASYIGRPDMTPQVCQSLCAGFQYAGTEYGDECYCGNSLTNNGATGTVIPTNNCNVPCAGDPSQSCGAGWTLSVYTTGQSGGGSPTTTSTQMTPTATGFAYLGCVAEGTTGSRRSLTGASYSRSDMTPQVCQSLCAGYMYAGVEYGDECYCGNSLTNNGATGAVIPASSCNSNCAGDSSQTCGGGWALSMYTQDNSWNNVGCYTDASTRALQGATTSQPGMTTEMCIGFCSSQGYNIAGTEYGSQCWCDNQLNKSGGAGSSVGSGDCNMPCSGNPSETCGAGWRLNVYTKTGTNLKRHLNMRFSGAVDMP